MANKNPILGPLSNWIKSCAVKGKPSRNTVAVGIVVLDHLRRQCPVNPAEVQSARGEIKGARSGLSAILEKYGIPPKYLAEVTTRAGHQDGQRLFEAFDYGSKLQSLDKNVRDEYLKSAIDSLVSEAFEWLGRQNLKIACDRQLGPAEWIAAILREAKGKSGGKVEQHLVGAKLEERLSKLKIPNNPGHAGDAQTGRSGDFMIGRIAIHVTANPGSAVVDKCKSNLGSGLHPMLLVPREEVSKARHIAEDRGIAGRMTIMAIEDYIAANIIEMSTESDQEFVAVLKSIVAKYNQRLEEVETDMSLKIDLE